MTTHVTRIVLAFTLAFALTGCTRWPDAPRLESVTPPPAAVATRVQKEHPGARIITPVYQLNTDTGGSYQVTSQTFVFTDAAGQAHRAELDANDKLTVQAATLVDELPAKLHQRFFSDKPGDATGGDGEVAGQVWRFTDGAGGETYEFEFESAGRRGLGRISAEGPGMSRYLFRAAQ